MGQFTAEIEYHQGHLTIAKEVVDNAEKIVWYGNIGNVYQSLDGSKTAIEHRQYNVQIAQNVRDKASEGISHDNLGKAYRGLGQFKKGIRATSTSSRSC